MIKNKKILFLVNDNYSLYNFRKELVEEFNRNNDVYLCAQDGPYREYFENLGCHYIVIDFDRHGTNPINEIKLINKYKMLISNINPDIVLTFTIKQNSYGGIACSKLNIPYIANITGLGPAMFRKDIVGKIAKIMYKKGLKKASCVFFQNKTDKEFMFENKIFKGNYNIIPGSGVNLEEYKALPYPNDKNINFAFISRIVKEKGINQYLDATKTIKQKFPNTTFHVCGFCEDTYDATKLKKLDDNNIIRYHGMIKEVNTFLKDIHCVVLPSYYPEGINNVLLEACACARPIITTNKSGCKELVKNDVNGYICKQKDTNDLIDKMEKFIQLNQKKKKSFGLAGRLIVEKNYDRKFIINEYYKTIEDILNEL